MTVYTLQMLHNFTHGLVISSLVKWLKVSILPNVHFLWCTTRRLPHSFSQRFPARKIFTLRFHRCRSHILQRPPLVNRLRDKLTPSPKFRKSEASCTSVYMRRGRPRRWRKSVKVEPHGWPATWLSQPAPTWQVIDLTKSATPPQTPINTPLPVEIRTHTTFWRFH
jgi:hypothetical protein